jgi:hypothetical protein
MLTQQNLSAHPPHRERLSCPDDHSKVCCEKTRLTARADGVRKAGSEGNCTEFSSALAMAKRIQSNTNENYGGLGMRGLSPVLKCFCLRRPKTTLIWMKLILGMSLRFILDRYFFYFVLFSLT